jgi:hypothetical protein
LCWPHERRDALPASGRARLLGGGRDPGGLARSCNSVRSAQRLDLGKGRLVSGSPWLQRSRPRTEFAPESSSSLIRSYCWCGSPHRPRPERGKALLPGLPAGPGARSASLADAGWSQAATAVLAWSLQSGGPTYRLHVPEPRFPVPSFLIRWEERPEQPHERLGMNRLADEQSPLR